jgi:hypothetical protein
MGFDPVTGWGHSMRVCECGCAPVDRPGLLISGFVSDAVVRFGRTASAGLYYTCVAFNGHAISVLGTWTPEQARAAVALETMSPTPQ